MSNWYKKMPLEGESRYCCIPITTQLGWRWYIVEIFFSGGGQQFTIVDAFKSCLTIKLNHAYRTSAVFWRSFVYFVGGPEPEGQGFMRGDLFGPHDQFESLPPLQSYRYKPTLVTVGDVLYVFAGDGVLTEQWGECYDLSKGVDSRWKPLKSPPKEYTLPVEVYAVANGTDQIIVGDMSMKGVKNIIIYCIRSDSWIEPFEACPLNFSSPPLFVRKGQGEDASDVMYYFNNYTNTMHAYDLKTGKTYKTEIWYNDKKLLNNEIDFARPKNPSVMHVSGDNFVYVSVEKDIKWGYPLPVEARPAANLVRLHFTRFSVSELCQEECVIYKNDVWEPHITYSESRSTKPAILDGGYNWEVCLEVRLLDHKVTEAGRSVYPSFCLEKLFSFRFKDLYGRVHMLNFGIENLGELVSAVSLRMGSRSDQRHLQLLYKDGKGNEVMLITNKDLVNGVSHARSVGQKVLELHLDFSQRKGAMKGRRSKWVLASAGAAVVIPSFIFGVVYYLKPTVCLKFNKKAQLVPKVAEF